MVQLIPGPRPPYIRPKTRLLQWTMVWRVVNVSLLQMVEEEKADDGEMSHVDSAHTDWTFNTLSASQFTSF